MITSDTIAKGIIKGSIGLAIIYFLALGFLKIFEVFIYFVVAIILTLMLSPLIKFLKTKLKMKNLLAVFFSFLFVFLFIFGIIMMIAPLISSQSKSLALLNPESIQRNLLITYNDLQIFLFSKGIDLSQIIHVEDLFTKIDFHFVPSLLNGFVGFLSSFGIGLVAVLFITFFFLKDLPIFIAGFKSILPEKQKDKILISLEKVNHLLSRYFLGLLAQLLIVFTLNFIVLLIVGVDYAFTIAFICALFNLIPYLGPLIGMVFAATLTMISHIGFDFQTEILPKTIGVVVGFMIVQAIDNNLSQPFIFSNSVNSHPLEIFIITIISGLLMGITGMIIAIPLYTIIKVFAKEFYPNNKIIWLFTRKL